jgi:uncharacterized sulfatase
MAAEGITFDHAFSNAPVCSVARTTLATGCYAPRIGTQYHRRYAEAAQPDGLRLFSAYLREAGYYTSNNSKKDYNAIEGSGTWDESSGQAHWRKRKEPAQPFFHFASHTQSHESSLQFPAEDQINKPTRHSPAEVQLAPYHPDTPLFRYTHARYLDNMQVIDGIVADTIRQLEEDGVLEDTFVFYFGDHGGVLPRGKGYLYNGGLHVPLVVRIPKNFAHLAAGYRAGQRARGFVSFMDFAPTVLNLAALPVPATMDGKPFLGASVSMEEVESRDEAFGHADRMDEKYDLVRSIRKGRFHYMRCFQNWLPDGLQNNYRYLSAAFTEWRTLAQSGALDETQRAFFEARSVEMLFDCEADPHNVRNLAADLAHAATLQDLRERLIQRMQNLPDLSLWPESAMARHALPHAADWGREHRAEAAALMQIANLALQPFAEAEPQLRRALEQGGDWERYWAAMVCSRFGEQAAGLAPVLRAQMDHNLESVQLRSIECLGAIGAINPQPELIRLVNQTDSPIFATEALNSVVWFRDHFGGTYPVSAGDIKPRQMGADMDRRINYLNGNPYPEGKGKANKKGKSKKPAQG